jgi:hypothetical protein
MMLGLQGSEYWRLRKPGCVIQQSAVERQEYPRRPGVIVAKPVLV